MGVGTERIGSDDLINLEQALDPAYRSGAAYMFSADTLASLRKVKNQWVRRFFPA